MDEQLEYNEVAKFLRESHGDMTYHDWKRILAKMGKPRFMKRDQDWLEAKFNQGVDERKAFLLILSDSTGCEQDLNLDLSAEFTSTTQEIDEFFIKARANLIVSMYAIFDLKIPIRKQFRLVDDVE